MAALSGSRHGTLYYRALKKISNMARPKTSIINYMTYGDLFPHSHGGDKIFNSLKAKFAIIWKPVNGFAEQITWLVFIWCQL